MVKEVGVKRFDQAVAVAKKCEGLTIAILKKALNTFEVNTGDFAEGDLKLITGSRGLPLECLSIINAHGDKEWEYFEQLQTEFSHTKEQFNQI